MSHIVIDASALITFVADSAGTLGREVGVHISRSTLQAPQVLLFECANGLRRLERQRVVSADRASQAHVDLVDMAIDYWPYAAVAARAWSLRANLSAHDAAYVALAEQLGAPLVTLDRRIAQAPGVRCEVVVPTGG